ncbi:hypothetical protein FKM82_022555 [Ascaphus truei]
MILTPARIVYIIHSEYQNRRCLRWSTWLTYDPFLVADTRPWVTPSFRWRCNTLLDQSFAAHDTYIESEEYCQNTYKSFHKPRFQETNPPIKAQFYIHLKFLT